MKKLLLCLMVVGLLALALGATAGAKPPTLVSVATTVAGTTPSPTGPVWAAPAERTSPTVSAISPASWANDIDTSVTISGSGFVATPTVSVGSTALTSVTWVNGTTLTATVPWGLNPGVYPLTVVNPDGGSVTLANAYTVTPGIGQWNGGNLFGGDVHQLLMKPGDPNTLYAPAYGLVGLFRSTDAGQSWKFTGAGLVLDNYQLAVTPQHPDWLYAYTGAGVERSTDQGDSWNALTSDKWPDGRPMGHGRVYPSPSDPQVLFVSSYLEPLDAGSPGSAQGLIRSTNGGASWKIVPGLEGISVVDVAFDPSDPAQMVLVTKDARVYHSGDGGASWNQVASPPLSSLGFNEQLAYNPYRPGQVWIDSTGPDGVFKSTDASLSNWQPVTPATLGGASITFTGADSVYVTWLHSTDGGAHWQGFGPITGTGTLIFDPTNPQVGYAGDHTYGVQKTTDGGLTWQIKDEGLAGMTCGSLDISHSDPLRVFATFGFWPGVYRSLDGAGTWGFVQVPGSYPIVAGVCTDPTDPDRVYAISDDVYRSMDEGASWTDLGFVTSAPPPVRGFWCIAPDPFQSGHLLAALNTGSTTTAGYLYASSDYGASWQPVSMPQRLSLITDIAFDPQTPGLVYITTGAFGTGTNGTGVYRSTDGGASWTRIDDLKQPDMNSAYTISVATHPQHMLFVSTQQGDFRSTDGGATWRKTQGGPGHYLFADSDSTRLYAGDPNGLSFSSDGGDTWTKAAGAFGQLQITALACAVSNGQTIIYAATNGGQTGSSTAAGTRGTARATASRHVDAGIYRYVVVRPKLSLKLSGLKKGVLKIGKRLTAKGVVTPGALAGNKVRLVLQKKAGKWRTVKTVMVTIKRGGACSWTYKATKKGSFRLQVSMAKAAAYAAATTKWLSFKVK
jgi:photosystem II stability/assembly factor-like uncharacterized protein